MSAFTTWMEDDILDTYLRGTATPYVQLHSGDPGNDSDANVISGVPLKSASFNAPQDRTDGGREVENDADIDWDDEDISDGESVTWVSIWDGSDTGTDNPMWNLELDDPVTTGSDGFRIPAGELKPGVD